MVSVAVRLTLVLGAWTISFIAPPLRYENT